jgi:hypothetical protein
MEKKNKKLQLNKETIRNLSDDSLEQVAGGKRKGDSGGVAGCVTFNDKTACVVISGCHSCLGC